MSSLTASPSSVNKLEEIGDMGIPGHVSLPFKGVPPFSRLDVESLFFSLARLFWNQTPMVPGVVFSFSASRSFSRELGVLVLVKVARWRESWSGEGRKRDLRKAGSWGMEDVVREG